jgi:integrase
VNTIDNYAWAIRKHIVPAIGSTRLSSLTADQVDTMLRAKAKAGMSRSSMMRIRSVLVMALRHAERRGRISRNAAALVDTPAGPETEGRALTHPQAVALLDALQSDPARPLVTTALMLGLRPGEVLGLTWADVDLDNDVVHIRRSLKRERNRLRLGDLKTARSRRSLDLPSMVAAALREHRVAQTQMKALHGDGWNPDNLVFPTENGTPIDPSNLRRTFTRITEAAGLGRWRPNELRHTAASLLSDAGVALERVADVLGHDGTRMTALVYRHALAPSTDAAVAPMNKLFGDTPGHDGAGREL